MTAILATIAAICLLLISGLSLAGCVVALIVCSPLLLLFSPILVPAGLASTLLAVTLAAGAGSGATGLQMFLTILRRIIKFIREQQKKAAAGGAGAGGAGAGAGGAGGAGAGAGAEAKPPADKPAAKPPKPAAKPPAKPAAGK